MLRNESLNVVGEVTMSSHTPHSPLQSAAMLNSAITAFFTGSNPYNRTYSAFIHAGSFTGPWATTRNPSITVPMTITSLGLPQGIYFSGLAYSEQTLISLGYAFEQKVSKGKRPLPTFCDSYTC